MITIDDIEHTISVGRFEEARVMVDELPMGKARRRSYYRQISELEAASNATTPFEDLVDLAARID